MFASLLIDCPRLHRSGYSPSCQGDALWPLAVRFSKAVDLQPCGDFIRSLTAISRVAPLT